MGMRMAENISYYLFTVISITFLTTYVGTTGDKGIILKALLIGAVVHFVTIPLIGALSDKVGRRPLYIAGAIGVAAWSWIFFDLIASKSETKILLAVVVGLILHALMYSPQAAFFSELFGTSVRYTGASVGYQLASIFAGALAPIIAIELLGPATNGAANVDSVAIYMTIASVITLVAVFFAKETAPHVAAPRPGARRGPDVTSTHVAPADAPLGHRPGRASVVRHRPARPPCRAGRPRTAWAASAARSSESRPAPCSCR